jgi:alanine-synthesizing transaminase
LVVKCRPFSRTLAYPRPLPWLREFHRIRRLPPYVFAEVNRPRPRPAPPGEDIIDFGMGNPDSRRRRISWQKLIETVQDPRTHRYSSAAAFRACAKALAAYYARRFDVELDPETEVIATLGSKEGLANLAAAITSPGDTILVPNPSYPIHAVRLHHRRRLVRSIPPTRRGDAARAGPRGAPFGAEADRADRQFPSNPTATWRPGFLREVVAFAGARRSSSCPTSPMPRSISATSRRRRSCRSRGAKDIAVEFTSLSKTYSMPGWRMGFAVGNPRLINGAGADEILSRLWRLHADPGRRRRRAERPAGLRRRDARAVQSERRDVLIKGLAAAGWDMPRPRPRCSPGRRSRSASRISAASNSPSCCWSKGQGRGRPGIGFGENTATGHVRIALVENTHRMRQAVRNIVLESAMSGVILIGRDRKIVSFNAAAETMLRCGRADAIGRSAERFFPERFRRGFEQRLMRLGGDGEVADDAAEAVPTSALRADGEEFPIEAAFSRYESGSGESMFVAVLEDITRQKATEHELTRLNRLHSALGHINQAIVLSPDRDELFRRACRIMVEAGGFRMAWIGWHDPEGQRILPVAVHGDVDGYLDSVQVTTDGSPLGGGPSGVAFRERRPYICDDMLHDPGLWPWAEQIRQRNLRASAAFPLRLAGEVVGMLTVYAAEPRFFGSPEINLLDEAAADISFAIDNFRLEEDRRRAQSIARREQDFSDAMIESMPGVLYFYDDAGKFLRWNTAGPAEVRLPRHHVEHELRTPLNSIIGFTGTVLQGLAGPLNAEQAKQLGMVRTQREASAGTDQRRARPLEDRSRAAQSPRREIRSAGFDRARDRLVKVLADKKGLALTARWRPRWARS